MLFVILFLTGIGQAVAQSSETKPFRVGAGLGCSFFGYREETEAPINRYANALTYIVDGNIEKSNFLHSLNFNFFYGEAKMAAPYREYSHKHYNVYRGFLEYALDCRLWGNNIFPGYLGGSFHTIVNFTAVDEELAHIPTGFVLFSINLHATQKWIINDKNTLTLSAGFPVFGYAVRPPYAMTSNLWEKYINEENYLKLISLGEVTSIHNYTAFFADIKYQYSISELVSIYSGFGVELLRINFYHTRIDAICRLNAGVAFTF